jgi:hypothetical protein
VPVLDSGTPKTPKNQLKNNNTFQVLKVDTSDILAVTKSEADFKLLLQYLPISQSIKVIVENLQLN